jgi:hypothetical protein
MGLLNKVNAQAPPSQPRRTTNTPDFTIVDDGGVDVSQAPRRVNYNDVGTSHRDPGRATNAHQLRRPSGPSTGTRGHHNTADDILPHLVKEVFKVDIRPAGDRYNTVYRIRMRDGEMRMMTSTLIDDHGLRPFVDDWWREKKKGRLTAHQQGALDTGCY